MTGTARSASGKTRLHQMDRARPALPCAVAAFYAAAHIGTPQERARQAREATRMAHLLIAFIITSASVATKPGRYSTKGTFVLLAAHASTQNHLRSCVPSLGTPYTEVKRTSASAHGADQAPPNRAPATPGPYALACGHKAPIRDRKPGACGRRPSMRRRAHLVFPEAYDLRRDQHIC